MTRLGATVLGDVAATVPFSAVDGPGNRFVVFLQGCWMDCLACHNPRSIPARPGAATPRGVASLLEQIADAAPFLSGVTVSGGEPTQQADFVHDLFAALRDDRRTARLTRLIDSNGDAATVTWDLLGSVMDGAMIDLKALDDDIHLVLTGVENTRILASLQHLAAAKRLAEVRLLLVPGLNDADEQLRRTAHWLLRLDPAIRVRVNAFRRTGTRPLARDLLEVGPKDLARYAAVLASAGIANLIIPPGHLAA